MDAAFSFVVKIFWEAVMKTTQKKRNIMFLTAVPAIALVLVFMWAGCSNPAGGTPGNGGIVISGTLTPGSSAGGVDTSARSFYAEVNQTARSIRGRNLSRAALGAVESYPISGKLEDGSIIFNLTGVYEPEGKAFTLEAASSFIIFRVSGRLNNSNVIDTTKTEAAVLVKTGTNNGGEWATIPCSIATSGGGEISGTVNAPPSSVNGIPESLHGKWRSLSSPGEYFIVSTYSVNQYLGDGPPAYVLPLVSFTSTGGSLFPADMIIGLQDVNSNTPAYYERYLITDDFNDLPAGIKNHDLGGGYTVEQWITSQNLSEALYVAAFSVNNDVAFNTIDAAAALDPSTHVTWVDYFTSVLVR
ncbi:MAG: hypothetical protein LBQ44_09035 [Treponema sp.]|jgi:hypothetical protein|nr:hypothetical protein [Treponema sp.]